MAPYNQVFQTPIINAKKEYADESHVHAIVIIAHSASVNPFLCATAFVSLTQLVYIT